MTIYPIGTLVRHRYHLERGLGMVMRHTNAIKPNMGIRWFNSTLATYESMSGVISIKEIDNDE